MYEKAIKILMVDDDKEDFLIVEQIVKDITHFKYSIDWTPSFIEGLNLISQKEHDVYLVDYKLGAKTGLDLIKKAIENGCEAPLIILTGDHDIETDKQALAAGASDYLIKATLSSQIMERSIRYAIANASQLKEMNRLNSELENRVKERTLILEETLSELKKFQIELIESKNQAQQAAKKAEEASRSKSHFLSSMSHEIRTPMNAIVGFTKVILNTELTKEQREYLNAIKISGDLLIVLINDILDLAKVESGKMTFIPAPFNIRLAIDEVIKLFESKAKESNLILEKRYDSFLPEVIIGDKVRLNQIVLNLISNAIKFTAKGKITVSLYLVGEDEEKVTVEFSIIDTGIGIPEDKLDTIFEKFQQANDDTSKLYGGTGLGLPIAKQFIELQGGSINVKSKVNEGSTFSFRLSFRKIMEPTYSETRDVSPFLDGEQKGELKPKTDFDKLKILVAEDQPINQFFIKTIIEQYGFEIDIAKNGKVATEMLQKNKYDIVLMDIQMPVMDGFEATACIRSEVGSYIPIIGLTADVTSVDLEKCKAMGMNDYISKPIDGELLYSTIIKHVKNSQDEKTNGIDGMTKNSFAHLTKKRVIDLQYLNDLMRDDPKGKADFIEIFLDEIPKLISGMKHSLVHSDWKELQKDVHSLIPCFVMMGINPKFEEMARKIERSSITKENLDEIQELLLQIDTICHKACKELQDQKNIL